MKVLRLHKPARQDRIFFIEIILALGIILAPFIIYLHLLFPETPTDYFLFWKHKHYNNQALIWHFLTQFAPLFLISILFISQSSKCRYAYIVLFTIIYYDLVSSLMRVSIVTAFTSISAILILVLGLILLLKIDRYYLTNWRRERIVSFTAVLVEFGGNRYRMINAKIRSLLSRRHDNNLQYLCRIYYVQELLRLDFSKIFGESTYAHRKRYSFILNWMILGIAGFLVVLWAFVPSNLLEFNIAGLKIGSFGLKNIQTLVWYLGGKLAIVLACLVWLTTNPNWWRYAIISPLMFYIYQILELLLVNNPKIEDYSNFKIFPLAALALVLFLIMSEAYRSILRARGYHILLSEEFEDCLENEVSKR